MDEVDEMRLKRTKTATVALAVLLVAALVVPTVAFAAPGATGTSGGFGGAQPAGTGSGTGTYAGAANLEARIAEALQRRAQRFDSATKALEQRRERIMELAGVVEKAGGDVEPVRTRLEECERLMVQAREQERTAAQLFKEVPNAGDRRGAFIQARVQARTAVQTLNQARVQLREAAQLLRDIADELQESDGA